jgi:O-antigen biosynthesis protein WbqP
LKRTFDVLVSALLIVVFALPMLLIATLIRCTSKGPAIHWSRRVGKDQVLFWMPKFRTMRIDTPQLATHLLLDAERWITGIGAWLRRTSLDELPQLWSILRGDMSFVGPRPALFNQHDLMALRTAHGIHSLTPGLSGWAQINGRDELSIPDKVSLEAYYLKNRSVLFDIYILWLTVIKVFRRDGIRQASDDVVDAHRRAA